MPSIPRSAANRQARADGGSVVHSLRYLSRSLANGLRKVDRDTGWTTFYMLCLAMLPISGILLISANVFWPNLYPGRPGADEVYTYMGILSVLLVHYVHDALLFTNSEAIVS